MSTSMRVVRLLLGAKLDLLDVPEEIEERISLERFEHLFSQIAARSRADTLGLQSTDLLTHDSHGCLGYLFGQSKTLRHAIAAFCQYSGLLSQDVSISFIENADTGVLTITPNDRSEHSEAFWIVQRQFWLAQVLSLSRLATCSTVTPTEVSFSHASPNDLSLYRRTFNMTPRFGAQHDEISLSRQMLDTELPNHNAELVRSLEEHAERALQNLAPYLIEQVEAAIREELSAGELTIAGVADRLDITTRSLQRRLLENGTNFSQILSSVRLELAKEHLGNASLQIEKIAQLLGFSCSSTFCNAFKRWTGQTASQFRQVIGVT